MTKYFSLSGNSIQDHELLSRIAKKDENRFEELRQQIIDEFMATVPVEKIEMLSRTQWKVDQVRRLAKNPVDACQRISRLMWESLDKLNTEQQRLLDVIYNEMGEVHDLSPTQHETATILQFKLRKQNKA